MLKQLLHWFIRSLRGCYKYGYFAPLVAAILTIKRSGGYWLHCRALYRLAFWQGQRFP